MVFLSLVAQFKNEAHILDEWLKHYLNQGVERIYLIDNGSTDNPNAILAPYIAKRIVTVVRDPRPKIQPMAYSAYFRATARKDEWVIVVDLDEFIYARKGFKSIADFLRRVSPSTDAICVPWKFFGSNGHIKQPEGVVRSFTKRGTCEQGSRADKRAASGMVEVKTIVRGPRIRSFQTHMPLLLGEKLVWNNKSAYWDAVENMGRRIVMPGRLHNLDQVIPALTEEELEASPLHLNHYQVQSREWWEKVKLTRGDAIGVFKRTMEHFHALDLNDIPDDELARINEHL